jgi:hypothetical protein
LENDRNNFHPDRVKTEAQHNTIREDGLALSGRPRLSMDFALILHLRDVENLGWSTVAREYTKRTGQDISTETCRRRYAEVRRCTDVG